MINSIKSDRQDSILSLLSESELLAIQEVARRLGRVSAVTIRRNVAEMAERGCLSASMVRSRACEILRVDGRLVVRDE